MYKFIIIIFINFFLIYPNFAQEKILDSKENYLQDIQSIKAELESLKTESEKKLEIKSKELDNLWLCIAGFLVFFMQAGFALVEAGFTRAKNTVNILMKNLSDFSIGAISYWIIGFSLMFAPQLIDGFGIGKIFTQDSFSFSDFFVDGNPDSSQYTFFFFQTVFAGTATTIASGAMAERTKFISYLLYSLLMTAFIYPIFGSFAWKGLIGGEQKGFLENMGFIDFAGSTVVHSVGGWAGLAGTLILGYRLDRYHNGKIEPIFGHNMSLATLGVFILWFGWFGFNPGSTGTIEGSNFAIVAVTTTIAAASGALGAMLSSWIVFKLPDIGITLNGVLAGLVAITAGCNNLNIGSSLFVGFVAGCLIVPSVLFFDKLKIDDPVGAISVHGVAGAWGTIAVGLFANPKFGGDPTVAGLFYGGGWKLLGVQSLGVLVAFVWSFSASLSVFWIMKKTIGLRVNEDEEILGLDILEHGNEAYPISK